LRPDPFLRVVVALIESVLRIAVRVLSTSNPKLGGYAGVFLRIDW